MVGRAKGIIMMKEILAHMMAMTLCILGQGCGPSVSTTPEIDCCESSADNGKACGADNGGECREGICHYPCPYMLGHHMVEGGGDDMCAPPACYSPEGE